jgi:hypothetical protein
MLRFVIPAGALAMLLSACTTSSFRTQEGHACSVNASDDPQLVCTPAQDLICIATYNKLVTNVEEAKKFDGGLRPVYLCRLACNVTADCPQAGDVCCPGHIHGKTYGKMGGCTPPSNCEAESSSGDEDAGATPPPDARPDTRPADAAAPDAGSPTGPSPDAAAPAADAPGSPG